MRRGDWLRGLEARSALLSVGSVRSPLAAAGPNVHKDIMNPNNPKNPKNPR